MLLVSLLLNPGADGEDHSDRPGQYRGRDSTMDNFWKFLSSDRAPDVMKQLRLLIREVALLFK
jgi:hypothetical protein